MSYFHLENFSQNTKFSQNFLYRILDFEIFFHEQKFPEIYYTAFWFFNLAEKTFKLEKIRDFRFMTFFSLNLLNNSFQFTIILPQHQILGIKISYRK